MFKLSFYGASNEVTGSCFLLESDNTRLLVDCGLFQCPKYCDLKNEEDFPFDVGKIDALVVTHAHIDHIGRIPKLVKSGFKGKIFSTPATRDFAKLMLLDSMGVLEKEAKYEKREVLYDENDIESSFLQWGNVEYRNNFKVGGFEIFFKDAGHILGSAIIEISGRDNSKNGGKTKVVFTGDLGNPPVPILMPTEKVTDADFLVVDSTYGDRIHEGKKERKLKLERAIENVIKNNGVLMLPAFSLERTQEIIFEINDLVEHGRVPKVPVFLDSPLAIKLTDVYKKYEKYYNTEAKYTIDSGDDLFKFPGLKLTLATDESKEINNVSPPKIIIAGSGTLNGGRILHHVRRYASDPNSIILFVGYQPAGSLGRIIKDGAKEVNIFGDNVKVRCGVEDIHGYSAHPDREQIMDFIKNTSDTLKKVFSVHGESKSSLFLVQQIRDYIGVDAIAPKHKESFELL